MAIQTVIMVDDSVAPTNGQMFIVPCHSFPQTVYGIMVHDIFHGSFGTFVFSRHSLHICTILAQLGLSALCMGYGQTGNC